jgi:alanine dehydrogenase
MKIGVPIEQLPGERRVALVPASIAALKKAGFEVMIERGAGERAGFPDSAYEEKGGQIAASRADVFAAEVVLQVRASDFAQMRQGQIVIAYGRSARVAGDRARAGIARGDRVRPRVDSAHYPRAEHGCPVVDGDDCRV